MDSTVLLALITFGGTIIASGGATALIQHFISKKGKAAKEFEQLNSRIDKLETSIEDIDNKIDTNEAQRARTQILRFADEVYNGILHTKEHFTEILNTCKVYNDYCEEHPKFTNMITIHAQERINEIYRKCEKEHSFLDDKRGLEK